MVRGAAPRLARSGRVVGDFVYKVTSYYDAATESGFRFDDPDVGIEWPDVELLYSERDRTAPRLAEIAADLPF